MRAQSRSFSSHIPSMFKHTVAPILLGARQDRLSTCISSLISHRSLTSPPTSLTIIARPCFTRRMSSASSSSATSDSSLTEVQVIENGNAGPGERAMGWWLLGCCGLVLGMVSLGGVTRLTGSGLSMVKWRPHGEYPPMTQEEWEAEFEEFKLYPEYQMKRKYENFTLEEFKFIYFMEWSHRMAGRVLGIAFAGPLIYFAARVMPPSTYSVRPHRYHSEADQVQSIRCCGGDLAGVHCRRPADPAGGTLRHGRSPGAAAQRWRRRCSRRCPACIHSRTDASVHASTYARTQTNKQPHTRAVFVREGEGGGGAQGLVGWWMVKSGLEKERLAMAAAPEEWQLNTQHAGRRSLSLSLSLSFSLSPSLSSLPSLSLGRPSPWAVATAAAESQRAHH